jgi:hypothetical protein
MNKPVIDELRMKLGLAFLLIIFFLVGCSIPGQPGTGAELEGARHALINFFTLLHDQQYDKAINYYGGDYEELRYFNPDTVPHYRDVLFRQACTVNGFLCMDIKSIVNEVQMDSETFRFIVEFQNDDGSLFVLGPCCGATEKEMPPLSEFEYTVKFLEGRFQVMELPVYVP